MQRHLPALLLPLLLAACGPGLMSQNQASTPRPPPCDDEVDYHCDVRPLIERHCISCHAEGGIAPFPLTTYAQAAEMAPALAAAVADRTMPPWPPAESEACPPLVGSRALSVDEIETFQAWAAADTPEGDEAQARADGRLNVALQEDTDLGEPEITFTVGAGYTPNQSLQDDYRCFIVDLALTRAEWMHAYEVVPGNRAIVHHVLLYQVMERDVAELQRWDDEDPGEGFECFGAPSPGIPMTLGGWVPGQRPLRYRQGDGAWMPARGRVVVQMHYNLISGPGVDETTVKLHLVEGQPFREIATFPFPGSDFNIPPGEAGYTWVEQSGPLPDLLFSDDLQIQLEGVAPHMHTLGESILVTLDEPGETPQCLVDIPRWDFHWQGFYLFNTEEPLPLTRGSGFTLSCTWDNTERKQLVVNGVRQEPRWVTWGEGTRDEMCLVYLIASGTPGWTQVLLTALEQFWD
ncbi:MAG: hypothetical protein AB2A00_36195 [Myxococcota bacterium]